MDYANVQVDAVNGRIALCCDECGEELASFDALTAVPLDVLITEVDSTEHECDEG